MFENHVCDDHVFGDKKFFNVYCVNGEIKQILCCIYYVHQLQNLYFQLTKEEILQ